MKEKYFVLTTQKIVDGIHKEGILEGDIVKGTLSEIKKLFDNGHKGKIYEIIHQPSGEVCIKRRTSITLRSVSAILSIREVEKLVGGDPNIDNKNKEILNKINKELSNFNKDSLQKLQQHALRQGAHLSIQYLFRVNKIINAMSFYKNAYRKISSAKKVKKDFLKNKEFGVLLGKAEHKFMSDIETHILCKIFGRDLRREILEDLKKKDIKNTEGLISYLKENNEHPVDLLYFDYLGVEYVGNKKTDKGMTALGNALRPEEEISGSSNTG